MKITNEYVKVTLRLMIRAGRAISGPPLGPTLGQYGIPIGPFCESFNEQTKLFRSSFPLMVYLSLKWDGSYDYYIYMPPTTFFFKTILKIEQGTVSPPDAPEYYYYLQYLLVHVSLKKNSYLLSTLQSLTSEIDIEEVGIRTRYLHFFKKGSFRSITPELLFEIVSCFAVRELEIMTVRSFLELRDYFIVDYRILLLCINYVDVLSHFSSLVAVLEDEELKEEPGENEGVEDEVKNAVAPEEEDVFVESEVENDVEPEEEDIGIAPVEEEDYEGEYEEEDTGVEEEEEYEGEETGVESVEEDTVHGDVVDEEDSSNCTPVLYDALILNELSMDNGVTPLWSICEVADLLLDTKRISCGRVFPPSSFPISRRANEATLSDSVVVRMVLELLDIFLHARTYSIDGFMFNCLFAEEASVHIKNPLLPLGMAQWCIQSINYVYMAEWALVENETCIFEFSMYVSCLFITQPSYFTDYGFRNIYRYSAVFRKFCGQLKGQGIFLYKRAPEKVVTDRFSIIRTRDRLRRSYKAD